MKLLTRWHLQWQRFWLRWSITCDESLRQTTEEQLEQNYARLRRVQMRLAQVTPAHLMMKEVGK